MKTASRLNAAWHKGHPMPRKATLDQRVSWHLAHAAACACRAIPATIVAELKARGLRPPQRRGPSWVRTHGLSHINLAVRDPERSLAFYSQVFGVKEYYRDGSQVQVQGPGLHDVLAFERNPRAAGKPGGIGHFGFRLLDPADIDAAVDAARKAGGRLLRRGSFGPGLPFAYLADPDGYEIEIWFE
jgi:catechol 2,3-dioxygenase-like lactoylglutathione lyase family enzyme